MIVESEVMPIVTVAKALADANRVRLLMLLQAGRSCCNLPCCSLTEPPDLPQSICNCELKELLGLPQSTVSYHIKVLREAGLIVEHPVGKWSYLSIHPRAEELLHALLNRVQSKEE